MTKGTDGAVSAPISAEGQAAAGLLTCPLQDLNKLTTQRKLNPAFENTKHDQATRQILKPEAS